MTSGGNNFNKKVNFVPRPNFLIPPRISVTHFASPGMPLDAPDHHGVLLMRCAAGIGDSECRYQYGNRSQSMCGRHTSSKSSPGRKETLYRYRCHLGGCSRAVVRTVCRHSYHAIPSRSSSAGQFIFALSVTKLQGRKWLRKKPIGFGFKKPLKLKSP